MSLNEETLLGKGFRAQARGQREVMASLGSRWEARALKDG